MHMSTPPYIDELEDKPLDVQAEYAAILDTQCLVFEAHGIDAKPCGFFDLATRKCRHYEHRPDICIDFEMGSDDCLATRGDLFETNGGTA